MSVEHPCRAARVGVAEVFHLAWPIIVSMLSFTAMSVVDTIYVGQLGTAPLAAVGLAAVTCYTVHGFGNGVLTGLKVAVAQETGAQRHDRGRRLAWQGLWLAVALGVAEAALWPLSEAIFALYGASAEVRRDAADYFAIRVLGAPLAFAMFAASAWFQGRGEVRLPMVATVLANGLNIVLDPVFIFGLGPIAGMGVAGAAMATVVAYGFGAAFMLRYLLPRVRTTQRGLSRPLLARVWRLGAPIGVRMALEIGSFMVFTGILAGVGDAHLAAHVIVVRIFSVSFLPGYGISEAVSILVGQAVGAGRVDRGGSIRDAGARLAVTIMACFGVLFVALPEPFIAIFDPSAAVASVAAHLMIIAAGFQVFDAFLMATVGALNGAGDTRFVMVWTVLTSWAVKVPIGWALAAPAGMGAPGAWLGLTVEVVLAMALFRWRFRSGGWRSGATAG